MSDVRVIYDQEVSFPSDLEKAIEKGGEYYPSLYPDMNVKEEKTEEGYRKVTFTKRMPITRTIQVKPFPDAGIAKAALEGRLEYSILNKNFIYNRTMLKYRIKKGLQWLK